MTNRQSHLSMRFPTTLQPRGTTLLRLLVLLLSCNTLASVRAGLQAQTPSNEAPQRSLRDGQHDFDFNVGVWHTRIRRVLDPFDGGTKSITLNGTVTVRKVWDGKAQLEEIEADGPNGHWEGMTLFLYNPHSHQWSQTFIDSAEGVLTTPTIGDFHDGRGELFAQETVGGKFVLIRGVWSNITPDAHHFEEDYSKDGGRTWLPVFIAELNREDPHTVTSAIPPYPETEGASGQHDFDFDFGTWKTHSSRLLNPLSGSKEWAQLDGTTTVSKIWNGRANLAEVNLNGPSGPLQLLALRWFNPSTHEWNLDFATPGVGTLGVPGVGQFKDGNADFYDDEDFHGRSILVRFSFRNLSGDSVQSDQAFSTDGGKTWETNWNTKYTRVDKEKPR